MKSWLDIKEKGGNKKNNAFNQTAPLIADGIDNLWSSLLCWTSQKKLLLERGKISIANAWKEIDR